MDSERLLALYLERFAQEHGMTEDGKYEMIMKITELEDVYRVPMEEATRKFDKYLRTRSDVDGKIVTVNVRGGEVPEHYLEYVHENWNGVVKKAGLDNVLEYLFFGIHDFVSDEEYAVARQIVEDFEEEFQVLSNEQFCKLEDYFLANYITKFKFERLLNDVYVNNLVIGIKPERFEYETLDFDKAVVYIEEPCPNANLYDVENLNKNKKNVVLQCNEGIVIHLFRGEKEVAKRTLKMALRLDKEDIEFSYYNFDGKGQENVAVVIF